MSKKFWFLAVILCGTLAGSQAWAQGLKITVLSSFPELVTGGDALVEISGVNTAPSVTVGGRNVSAAFTSDGNGAWIGYVDGLSIGDNALVAAAGGNETSITLVNYSLNGTLFAGPQQTPFICENEVHGLLQATDETCAAPTIVSYSYRSTDGEWKEYDPKASRPTDIENTTTMDGNTVPLIVWREVGVINRSAYIITLLNDPENGPLPTPTTGAPGWNKRLMFAFRGGVRPAYHMGRTIGSLDEKKAYVGGNNNNLHESLIRAGYALAAGSLAVTGTNTNHVVQAETMAKIKERFIELFGPPKFTFSMGTSGGSMSQHLVAQDYPGLIDAINPWRSYPEVLTFNQPLNDCNLLVKYFDESELAWTDKQMEVVSGKVTWGFCVVPAARFPNLSPDNCDTAVKDEKTFSPDLWKDVRCTYQDNLVNVYGTDPETGFARSPWDNVGVQYGLNAFNDGVISFEQFAQLNADIGGHDINGVIVPKKRAHADTEAVRIAYETGRLNTGDGGLATIPILDIRGYTDDICTRRPCPPADPTAVDVHDGYHTLMTRARLIAANGNADNHVRIVTTEVGHRDADSVVSIVSVKALALLDQWVTGIVDDTSNRSAAEKMAAHRPKNLVDACYTGVDSKITDMDLCADLFPIGSDARLVAGASAANDILKCSLKPVDAGDYAASLTSQQLARLQQSFPEGVCDYSKLGIEQKPLKGTWAFYTGNGAVEYLRPAR